MRIILFILFCSPYILHAREDQFSNERQAAFRSSRTAVAQNHVLLATGSIHLWSVQIESPTLYTDSLVAFFNSTSASIGLVGASTAALVDTGTQINYKPHWRGQIELNVVLSSGLVINKIGAAAINYRWDYERPSEKDTLRLRYFP